MAPAPKQEGAPRSRHPLLLLVLVGCLVLLIPAFLYSLAPDGPFKEGDSVYSTGRHIVYFVHPGRYEEAGYTAYCVLEPRAPLLVLGRNPARPADSLVARAQSQTVRIERPFCPSQADVVVKPHQVTSKINLLGEIKDALARLLARS